jgi:hypothetical protein
MYVPTALGQNAPFAHWVGTRVVPHAVDKPTSLALPGTETGLFAPPPPPNDCYTSTISAKYSQHLLPCYKIIGLRRVNFLS